MKGAARNFDMLRLHGIVTLGAGVLHVGHVVLFAVHLVVELIVGALYWVVAHTADTLINLNQKISVSWSPV